VLVDWLFVVVESRQPLVTATLAEDSTLVSAKLNRREGAVYMKQAAKVYIMQSWCCGLSRRSHGSHYLVSSHLMKVNILHLPYATRPDCKNEDTYENFWK
jgi:hypothetical protein